MLSFRNLSPHSVLSVLPCIGSEFQSIVDEGRSLASLGSFEFSVA